MLGRFVALQVLSNGFDRSRTERVGDIGHYARKRLKIKPINAEPMSYGMEARVRSPYRSESGGSRWWVSHTSRAGTSPAEHSRPPWFSHAAMAQRQAHVIDRQIGEQRDGARVPETLAPMPAQLA